MNMMTKHLEDYLLVLIENNVSPHTLSAYKKHLNDEHHDEFQLTGINLNDVKNMVQERYIHYDHNIDKKNLKKKWSKDVKIKLSKIEDNFLPKYLKINKEKYKNWFDNG